LQKFFFFHKFFVFDKMKELKFPVIGPAPKTQFSNTVLYVEESFET
jgi:hypothetical protein